MTSLIFELERRPKAQNVGNLTGHLNNIPNFRWQFRRKLSFGHQNFVVLKIFEIFNTASIWHQIWKEHISILFIKMFHNYDVSNVSLLYSYIWNWHILTITLNMLYQKTLNADVQLVYCENDLIDNCENDLIDDVIMSDNMSKFCISKLR